MSDLKRCIQCGLLKDASEFRKYTYSRKKETEGRYRTCKSCEAINASYTRLLKRVESLKGTVDTLPGYETEYKGLIEAINKIESMYATLERQGLRVPAHGVKAKAKFVPEAATMQAVDKLNHFYGTVQAEVCARVEVSVPTPDELQKWLDADMQDWVTAELSPEYLQETIYESLKAKYRPQTGVDRNTFMPTYDDTYKDVLNQILRRFDDYEEMMSATEVEDNE